MVALWEISEEVQNLENKINQILENEELTDEEKDEQTQEVFQQYLNTEENFKEKAENVAHFIKNQEALAKARKEEAKRIQELAKQAENKANRLREYLKEQMKNTNNDKIEGVKTKLSIRKKQPELNIKVPYHKLPKEFCDVVYKPDKTKIKSYLKNNEVDWASLEESNDYSITIK